MTFINESGWDRALRIVVGTFLLYVARAVSSAMLGWVLLGVGLVALATGIVGWCPACSLFRFSTQRIVG